MATSQVVLGIDGGGTKTRCLVAGLNGAVLGEGIGGPSNYLVVGLEGAVANLTAAVEQALSAAGCSLADVAAVCAGLAGVGRPEDQAAMTQGISEALALPAGAPLRVVPDAHIALVGALQGRPGVNLISGTGSIAFGLDEEGRLVRAGGWGWILGDEGSGFTIGKQAIAAGLAALDGTGPATALGEAIRQRWGLPGLQQVTGRVYRDVTAARTEIAGLVPLVVEVADAGDEVARAILARAGQDLAGLAAAVLRRMGLKEPLVTATGGVAEGVAAVRRTLAERLAELMPAARLVESAGSPAEGAVLMARELCAGR